MAERPTNMTVKSLDGQHEMAVTFLEDEWCLDCIWCYDNGGDTPCNSEFTCEGQAQGFAAYKKGNHFDFLSKRAYFLDDNNEPKAFRGPEDIPETLREYLSDSKTRVKLNGLLKDDNNDVHR